MSTNQILAASGNWPELNLSSQTEGKTYVVTTDKTIDLGYTYTLARNVTIIFAGGIIKGSGTLIGNNTSIIAPVQQIFDINLNIKGIWIMDRAYPQWFGAKNDYATVTSMSYPSSKPIYQENRQLYYDATTAINKAINLKQVGEVFIPRGEYLVLGTIYVKTGIILKGEKSYTLVDGGVSNYNDYLNQGTVLRVHNSGTYSGGYLVKINASNANDPSGKPDFENTEFHTGLHDIYFCNSNLLGSEENVIVTKDIKGVLSCGAIDIKYCRWKGFAQAVATLSSYYTDSKSISYCHFSSEYVKQPNHYYAFDLSGMGDSLEFTHNHILKHSPCLQSGKPYLGGLKLYQTLGAEISNNILNADVKITNCKGVVFSNNHFEGNETQLQITRSTVKLSDNYFEKGRVPTIRIEDENNPLSCDTSVVSLDNNVFAYYENDTANKPSIHEYDIQMDDRCMLSVDKSYRYWVRRNSIHRKFPYGLAICNLNDGAIDSFNKHSYFLSNNGLITLGHSVVRNHAIKTQNTLGIVCELSNYVLWKRTSGDTYTYSAQFVWDSKRQIVSSVFPCASSLTPNSNNGVKLTLSGLESIGFQAPIRLFRKNVTKNIMEWCDLPVCGHMYLYDNGDSICGFKWESDPAPTQYGLTPTGAVEFVGDNVKMNCTACPTYYGYWTNGDIIFNIGSGANALWIRQGTNSWAQK